MNKIDLSKISTLPPKELEKSVIKDRIDELKCELKEYQKKLMIEPKESVLIVLQGMDAAGKDGIIRYGFTGLNPKTCSVSSFKKPTDLEMSHDFLWRIHQEVPQKGQIKIFNRSHYEDVIIQKVHNWVDDKTIEQRYRQINDFERLLKENNTKILKCYLHVSKEKQYDRLMDRKENEDEKYKHNENDWKEREKWDVYMNAYQKAFENCNEIPWTIIPADKNWFKTYSVLEALMNLVK